MTSIIVMALVAGSSDCSRPKGGNQYSVEMMPDGKYWVTENLNIDFPGSYCYDGLKSNCEEYGRLYTWEAAKEACSRLGDGWRLPTNEEWREMAKHYGGVRGDSTSDGKEAYKALVESANARFNALLGGGRDTDGNYRRLDAHGFYWTATESGNASAWLYNFGKGSLLLNRHEDGDKAVAVSARCIRDM